MTTTYLDFEHSIKKLDDKLAELKDKSSKKSSADITLKIKKLTAKRDAELETIYKELGPWERVQVARHPDRPHTLDYIAGMVDDFVELCGDRESLDDQAIVGGMGYIAGMPVMAIGEEKGGATEDRLLHNFGMPKPEGYRKAVRLMKLADKFKLPVVFFVDTSGAYPGAESEERGQSQAIAESIRECLDLSVPSIAVVIGEGGSGGAIAIAVANKIFMLENSVYSVISPEGCASILWKSQNYKKAAAEALKLTADDLMHLGVIDNIIAEPAGGAHRNKMETVKRVKFVVKGALIELLKSTEDPKLSRLAKYDKMTRVLA